MPDLYYAAACQTDFPCPNTREGIAKRTTRMCAMAEQTIVGYEPFHDVRLLAFPEFAHAAPIYDSVKKLRARLAVPVPNEHTERYEQLCRKYGCFIQTGTFADEREAATAATQSLAMLNQLLQAFAPNELNAASFVAEPFETRASRVIHEALLAAPGRVVSPLHPGIIRYSQATARAAAAAALDHCRTVVHNVRGTVLRCAVSGHARGPPLGNVVLRTLRLSDPADDSVDRGDGHRPAELLDRRRPDHHRSDLWSWAGDTLRRPADHPHVGGLE